MTTGMGSLAGIVQDGAPIEEPDGPCDWSLAFGYGYWCLNHNSGNVFRPSHTDLGYRFDPATTEPKEPE